MDGGAYCVHMELERAWWIVTIYSSQVGTCIILECAHIEKSL
jgi:hypothetical protein